ncbi:MAG: sigma-70 family RNA polymerase sigma factor [Bacteroidetes bacterium]|nr:sigma-70 family RNA polymerase sigma factor [Bacteroidota bacterium]
MNSERDFLTKIEKHRGIIFKISKMYMDCIEDQEDLFQEIVYQTWKAYPNFKGLSDFSTWLYRIAINTAILFLKNEKKKRNLFSEPQSYFDVSAERENNNIEEQTQEMYRAIQQLNPIDKALIFYYLEDYSGREIALQLGLTEANARVKMNRAKLKLKNILHKNGL